MPSSGSRFPARLLLDTSAYSHLRAGHPAVIERIVAADVVFMPVIVLGELEAAFRRGRRVEENRRSLGEFLDEPFVEWLPVTPDVARWYGALFADLRSAGTPISVNDVWIAASAIDSGAHLLSFDADFNKIRRLDCTVISVSPSS